MEHSFSVTRANSYDSLDEKGKNVPRLIETSVTMIKKLLKGNQIVFIGARFDYKEQAIEWQREINDIEIWI